MIDIVCCRLETGLGLAPCPALALASSPELTSGDGDQAWPGEQLPGHQCGESARVRGGHTLMACGDVGGK